MAKRSEVALVIERLQEKARRLSEDMALLEAGAKNPQVYEDKKREYQGVTSALSFLDDARTPPPTDKPKRERKKKNATPTTTTTPEL